MFAPSNLGAYPGDAYFDPARPSWLPYWIDSPTESQAKYAWLFGKTATAQQVVNPGASYPAPPMPPAVKPPADIVTPPASGADAQRTVDGILAQQMREWQQANKGFFEALAPTLEPDNTKLWLALAAAGLLIFFIARR